MLDMKKKIEYLNTDQLRCDCREREILIFSTRYRSCFIYLEESPLTKGNIDSIQGPHTDFAS